MPLTDLPGGNRACNATAPPIHNRPIGPGPTDTRLIMPQTFPSPSPLKVETALRFSPDRNRHTHHESTAIPSASPTSSPTTPTSTPTLKPTQKNSDNIDYGNIADPENGAIVIQDLHLLKINRLKKFEDCTCPTDAHALLINVFKMWHVRIVKEVISDHVYAKTPLELLHRICHVFENAEYFRRAVTLPANLQPSELSRVKSLATRIDAFMANKKFRAGVEYLKQIQCNNVDCECRCEQTVAAKETNNEGKKRNPKKKKKKGNSNQNSNKNKSNGESPNDHDVDKEMQKEEQEKQQQQQQSGNRKGCNNESGGKKRKLHEMSVDEPPDAKRQREFLKMDNESQKLFIKLERLKLQRLQFELDEKKMEMAERKDERRFKIKKLWLEMEHERNVKVQENFKELSKVVSKLGCALAHQAKNEREASERRVKEEDESEDDRGDGDTDSDTDSDDDSDDGKIGGEEEGDGDDESSDDEDDDSESNDDVESDDGNENGA